MPFADKSAKIIKIALLDHLGTFIVPRVFLYKRIGIGIIHEKILSAIQDWKPREPLRPCIVPSLSFKDATSVIAPCLT